MQYIYIYIIYIIYICVILVSLHTIDNIYSSHTYKIYSYICIYKLYVYIYIYTYTYIAPFIKVHYLLHFCTEMIMVHIIRKWIKLKERDRQLYLLVYKCMPITLYAAFLGRGGGILGVKTNVPHTLHACMLIK